jgi:acyl carrier protein
MKAVHAVARARAVLARHSGRDSHQIRAWDRLEADLDLTPLEMVLVLVEVEEALGVELPAEGLEAVETVGDLFAFLSRSLANVDAVAA